MIDPSQWANLGGLFFVARHLVQGLWTGRHASVRHGSGLDFHDYRVYTPGDNPAEVDWKLYGRTDRYYVKRNQQLTDLSAYILVDCSASMDFARLDRAGRSLHGDKVMTKLRYAQMLAAAIAFLTIRQGDRAGVGLFGSKLIDHVAPGGSWAQLQRVCSVIESAKPQAAGDVGEAIKQAHSLRMKRGLLVLISDLLDEPAPLFEGLSRFRHDRFDIVVFQILSPQELGLEGLQRARLQMIDSETKDRVHTDVTRVQKRYSELVEGHIASLRRGCQARQVDYNLLSMAEPVTTALRRYVSRRGR
ncbi:MAG: DUF58 domain-containing protein [Phycisphaeraceae bacterium]